MESNISDDELDAILKEVGMLPTSTATFKPLAKDESLEKLLEEIMTSSSQTASAAPTLNEEKLTFYSPEKEKSKIRKWHFLPLGLSIAILGGFFLGLLFGFYWGKTKRTDFVLSSLESIEAQLLQIKETLNTLQPPPAPEQPLNETLEPLDPPSDLEQLAPKAVV